MASGFPLNPDPHSALPPAERRVGPTGRLPLLLVVLASVFPTEVFGAIPPIRIWGELGFDYRLEDFDQDQQIGLVDVNAATFIIEPWVAQVEGGVLWTVRSQDFDRGSSSGNAVTGDGVFKLFPFSRFPFEAFFRKTDSNVDTDLTGVDVDLTRYGITQRYTTLAGNTARFRYEHSDRTQTLDFDDRDAEAEVDRDVVDRVQLTYTHTLANHGFDTDLTIDDIDRKGTGDDVDRVFGLVRHRFRSGPTFSVENRLTYTDRDQDLTLQTLDGEDTQSVGNEALEFNSFVFWRPQTAKRLLVNGTFRVRDSTTKSAGSSSDALSIFGTVGGTYEWSPRWRFSGNASVSRNETASDESTSTTQRAAATYTSETLGLGGFNYSWFAGPELTNQTGDEGSFQTAVLELGHTLDRTTLLGGGWSQALRGSQSLALLEDTEGRSTQTLLHNLSATWSQTGQVSTTLFRISASDSRTYGGGGRAGDEDSEFQLITFHANVNRRLSRLASLTGSADLRLTRSVTARSTTDDDLEPSASVNLTYTQRRVFNVPRLRFRSQLRLNSDTFAPFLDPADSPEDREQALWENRLEYTIGLLDVRFITRYTKFNEDDRTTLLLQVRRFFGAL